MKYWRRQFYWLLKMNPSIASSVYCVKINACEAGQFLANRREF